MGLGTLRAAALEPESLLDAETMLLVDDAKAEFLKGDAFLDEGVRAHGDPCGAASQRLEDAAFFGGLEASCEFEDGNAERSEPLAQFLGVLFGEKFRGRHEDGLMSAFEGAQQRKSRDDRFAASHVPLYESVHGGVLLEILFDFVPDALLRVCECEGERGEEGVDEVFARFVEARCAEIPSVQAGFGERNLLCEQFVEFEALPGGGRAVLE